MFKPTRREAAIEAFGIGALAAGIGAGMIGGLPLVLLTLGSLSAVVLPVISVLTHEPARQSEKPDSVEHKVCE